MLESIVPWLRWRWNDPSRTCEQYQWRWRVPFVWRIGFQFSGTRNRSRERLAVSLCFTVIIFFTSIRKHLLVHDTFTYSSIAIQKVEKAVPTIGGSRIESYTIRDMHHSNKNNSTCTVVFFFPVSCLLYDSVNCIFISGNYSIRKMSVLMDNNDDYCHNSHQ